ncbi:MAG TPA: hypothetical protein VJI73_00885 [Candidatus Paceibacterota bacterium]
MNISSNEEGEFKIEGVEWLSAKDAVEKLNFDSEKNAIRLVSLSPQTIVSRGVG